MSFTIDVTCFEHGEMKWREAEFSWQCIGFDGEGCCWLTVEAAFTRMPVDVPSILGIIKEYDSRGWLEKVTVKCPLRSEHEDPTLVA